jgi:hypothetical protein
VYACTRRLGCVVHTTLSPSALASKIYQRLSVALQRALSHRECAYIVKLRERGTLPPTTCAAEFLWDVQLGGTRVPTWAF